MKKRRLIHNQGKYLRDQKGFSLMEVMVGAGIMGIVALGISNVLSLGSMGQKTLQAQDDARVLTINIGNLLGGFSACTNTFSGLDPVNGGPPNPTVIRDQGNQPQFSVGSIYGNRTLKLNSLYLGGSGRDPKTGIQKWVQTGSNPTRGVALLQIDWLQTGLSTNQGPQHLYRYVLINVVSLDNFGKVSGCNAQSPTATGGGTTASPGGTTGSVQYNDNGTFGGDSGFTYAGNGAVTINGAAATALNASTSNSSGKAISGVSSATSGVTYGVYGYSASDNGYGVYGLNTAGGIGGHFSSSSGPALVTGSGNVGIGVPAPQAALDMKGKMSLRGSASGYSALQSPASAGNVTWILPTTDGAPGQVLSTNGAGVLSWVDCAPPASGCTAQTISNCSLSASLSGGSSGSCASGYTGSCSFTCNNGSWSQVSNSCVGISSCAGYSYNGGCYYVGNLGYSCDAVCSTHGGCNAAETQAIGVDASLQAHNAECQAVGSALTGRPWGGNFPVSNLGCSILSGYVFQVSLAPTTCAAAYTNAYARICGCNN